MERARTYSSPLPVTFTAMAGITPDLVVLLVGNLYRKIQEHEPLSTIISALVSARHRFNLLTLIIVLLTPTARVPILPEV